MICPQCHTNNPAHAIICRRCGIRLVKKPSAVSFLLLIGIAALFLAGSFYFYKATYHSSKQQALSSVPSEKILNFDKDAESSSPKDIDPGVSEGYPSIIPVKVMIDDIAGHRMHTIAAPLLENGWVAIPKRHCLGGYSWKISLENKTKEIPLEGGLLADDEPVGLWRIKDGENLNGAELSPWNRDKALEWAEFSDPFNEISVSVQEVHEKGRITEIVIAESAQAPGIFFQEEKVVGWTFGDSVNLGYVWRGIEGEELIEELRIDDFYRTTFANSREEKFVKALAMRDALAAEQLEAITNAFRYESVLASKQTPEYLKPEIIIKRMHELNLQLIDKGFVSTVADAYDVEILSAAADASILVQVTQANIQAYGYESALDIFEAVQKEYRDSGLTQSSELQNLHLKLYHRWLASLVAGGQTNQGKQVYERGRSEFPLDLRLYLYAVELVLMEGDWVEAQQLLDSREYPASLLKIVEELKTQIASQKSENEKIVIRFAPRSRNIFVDATIGDSVIQRFIVDTGASIVTVPSSTVNSLGISGDYNKLERKVYTVGGVTQAPQVVLPSIELNNWTEYNIKALVINLPGQPGYGLLGLNYLRRFQMDINYDDGVLILKPR